MRRPSATVQDGLLLYWQDGQEHSLLVGTPTWYEWLTTATIFTFGNSTGAFTAYKERAGNQRGGWYWKAYQERTNKPLRVYLGKSEILTLERLNAVARLLGGQLENGHHTDARSNVDSSEGQTFPDYITTTSGASLASKYTAAVPTGVSPQLNCHQDLTPREVEVLRLLANGLTNVQIAIRLVVSPLTVSTHMRSIYNKIGVNSRSAATRYAIEHQLA
jgi:DNA-binding CsgD family transcriptional regulator